MEKHLWLSIISTFVFGLITGAIIFVASNTGQEGGGDTIREARGITIIADAYGGCGRSGKCPSYRIVDNGTYRYVGIDAQGDVAQFNGELSSTQRTQLHDAVERAELDTLEDVPAPDTCAAMTDGLAYRYEISLDDDMYTFDTCVQDIESIPLFEVLQEYFTLFTVIHTSE